MTAAARANAREKGNRSMNVKLENFVTVPEGFEPTGEPVKVRTNAILNLQRQAYARVRREVGPGKLLRHQDTVLRYKGIPDSADAVEMGSGGSAPLTDTAGLEVARGAVCRVSTSWAAGPNVGRTRLTPAEVWGALDEAVAGGDATAVEVAMFLRDDVAAEAVREAARELVRTHAAGMSPLQQLTWLRQIANGNAVKGYVAAYLSGGLDVLMEVLTSETRPERLPEVVTKITT